MILLKLAFRNIFRHRVRTLLNLVMMVGSFCGIVLFLGFAFRTLQQVEEANVNSFFGHIQIAKKNFWERTPLDTEQDRMLTGLDSLMQKLAKVPEIEYASPRLSFYSLISLNDRTTSGQGWALDPKVEQRFQKSLLITEGKYFTGTNDYEMMIGSGLQNQLQAQLGQSLTLVSQTLDGIANAIDPELIGVFQTGFNEVDNTTFFVSTQAAQKLMDTKTAEKVLIILKPKQDLQQAMGKVNDIVKEQPEILVKPWRSLSKLYNQTEDYFDKQNGVIKAIMAILVLLGIFNTIGMAIYERTFEIGTVRALGDRKSDVLLQLLLEGLTLFLVSLAVAIPATTAMVFLINKLQIPIDLPGASKMYAIEIVPYTGAYLEAAAIILVATLIAVLIPSIRASRVSIVAALRR